MYASVRTYRCDPAQMEDLLRIVDEEFVPRISDQPGFCAYQVCDCGDGDLVTISCFQEAEQAENSTRLASEFVAESLSDFDIERTDAKAGALRISEAAEQVLEPAHV
jgi:hypothetical protein